MSGNGPQDLDGGDPIRVIACVAGPPLVAEAIVALGDLAPAPALVLRVAGVVAATCAVLSFVVRPLLATAARTRIAADDLEVRLAAERSARDFRERFERAIAGAEAEPASLRTGLRAVMELAPDHDVSLLLTAPDEPRVAWSVRIAGGVLRPAEPVPGRPGCLALSSGAVVAVAGSHELDACAHLGAAPRFGTDDLDPGPGLGTEVDLEVSAVCVPLRIGDRTLGVVCVTGPPGELPDDDVLASIRWVVERTGARVADQRRQRGPSLPGPVDAVTRLPGDVALRSHVRDLVRSLTPFCVALVQVDGADLMDTHDLDDQLRLLADTLTTTLRPDDVVCRLDGPRFAAVLQGCTADQASAAMERVREALVLELTMEGAAHFTCSTGIVESQRATSLDEVLTLADAACEAAHLQGGNRVTVSELD